MSIEITLRCSMCFDGHYKTVCLSDDKVLQKTFKEVIKAVASKDEPKWIVQFNGPNIDTYCSKKCAL